MAQAELGTRANCRWCGRSLVYDQPQFDPSTARWREPPLMWWHVEKEMPQGEDIGYELQYRPLQQGGIGSGKCWSEGVTEQTESWQRSKHDAAPREFCSERLQGDGRRLCGREVTYPDLFMCGTHAKPILEREERNRKQEARKERRRAAEEEIASIIEMFSEMWGIKVEADTTYEGPTGKVILDPKDLFKILKEDAAS